jgi:hypothetical protein
MSDGDYAWVDAVTAQSSRPRRLPALTLSEELWVPPLERAGGEDDRSILCSSFTLNALRFIAWAIDVNASMTTTTVPDLVVSVMLALLGSSAATTRIHGRDYLVVAVPAPLDEPDEARASRRPRGPVASAAT